MQLLRSSRWLLLGLLLSLVPASSYAGVFISVGFAPPVLPVYEQPPCPQARLDVDARLLGLWRRRLLSGSRARGCLLPMRVRFGLRRTGAGRAGCYVFHTGYWGPHVGYYGGVNYGFGYMGIGFVGGRWHGHDFEYNTRVHARG